MVELSLGLDKSNRVPLPHRCPLHQLPSSRQRATVLSLLCPGMRVSSQGILTCSLTEINTLAEVFERAITAWEVPSCVKVAILGIQAGGRKPHIAVFTGTLQEPLQVSAVYTYIKGNRTQSHCDCFVNQLPLSSGL